MEQTTRRSSCLDDSPLANAAVKEVQKEGIELPDPHCKELQSKDLLPSLSPPPFPVPHDSLADPGSTFGGSSGVLKFEPNLHMHGDATQSAANLDAPIIRLDGSSGQQLRLPTPFK